MNTKKFVNIKVKILKDVGFLKIWKKNPNFGTVRLKGLRSELGCRKCFWKFWPINFGKVNFKNISSDLKINSKMIVGAEVTTQRMRAKKTKRF